MDPPENQVKPQPEKVPELPGVEPQVFLLAVEEQVVVRKLSPLPLPVAVNPDPGKES